MSAECEIQSYMVTRCSAAACTIIANSRVFSFFTNCAQRWIYKKLMTRRTIKAVFLGKPYIKRHQFAEPTALRRTECTSRACGVNASLWVRPSTRPNEVVARAACKSCSLKFLASQVSRSHGWRRRNSESYFGRIQRKETSFAASSVSNS